MSGLPNPRSMTSTSEPPGCHLQRVDLGERVRRQRMDAPEFHGVEGSAATVRRGPVSTVHAPPRRPARVHRAPRTVHTSPEREIQDELRSSPVDAAERVVSPSTPTLRRPNEHQHPSPREAPDGSPRPRHGRVPGRSRRRRLALQVVVGGDRDRGRAPQHRRRAPRGAGGQGHGDDRAVDAGRHERPRPGHPGRRVARAGTPRSAPGSSRATRSSPMSPTSSAAPTSPSCATTCRRRRRARRTRS